MCRRWRWSVGWLTAGRHQECVMCVSIAFFQPLCTAVRHGYNLELKNEKQHEKVSQKLGKDYMCVGVHAGRIYF